MTFPQLADYHMHTPLCGHAEGLPGEYLAQAQALGLGEIGFSDHNPMAEPFDDWRMKIEQLPRYLELVEEARTSASIPVRLGLECDFLEGGDSWIDSLARKAPWDFLIGSVHYIAPGWDVDNPKWIGRFTERPVEEIWTLYFEALVRCIRSGLFDIIAHPDLVKKFGHRPSGDLRRWYEPCIQAAVDRGVAFEVSTAGLRKPVGEIYPAPDFLKMVREAGLPVVVSSDAHAPAEVGAQFEVAMDLLIQSGFTHTARFHQRRRELVPLQPNTP